MPFYGVMIFDVKRYKNQFKNKIKICIYEVFKVMTYNIVSLTNEISYFTKIVFLRCKSECLILKLILI